MTKLYCRHFTSIFLFNLFPGSLYSNRYYKVETSKVTRNPFLYVLFSNQLKEGGLLVILLFIRQVYMGRPSDQLNNSG